MNVVAFGPKLAKKKVLGVVGDVQEEPRRRRAQEVEPVAPRELAGEEAEGLAGEGLVHRRGHLRLLRRDLHLEHLGHVGRGALRVLGDDGGVPRRLRHPHPPVEGERRGKRAEHEDEPPHVVGLGRGGRRRVGGERRRGEPAPEDRGDPDRHRAAGEDPEPLHREHGGDERPARPLVRVLRHDGGAERVVAADAEAEPEAEEAERGHDARRRVPERQPRRDGADDHQEQRHAVDALPADPVAEPPEEELPRERADEGDAVHGRRDVGRQAARLGRAVGGVVDAADELGDEGDAEEVVGVGEEAHAGDDDGGEVVPLRLGAVQRGEHVHLIARHGGDAAAPAVKGSL
ncbi:Os03g0136450, partial [Oryza sativa Japonica Group]